jgi:UDP-N-acetylmuramate dehydrogenase
MRIEYAELKHYTSFRIGGPCRYLSFPESHEAFLQEIEHCKTHGIPHRILGSGSNILASSKGIESAVISLKNSHSHLTFDGEVSEAGAGLGLNKFILGCTRNRLGGYEHLISIPGTVGGAIYMNAGIGPRHNTVSSISDHLINVRCFDGNGIVTLSKEECGFGHRSSVFQKSRNMVILSATFKLEPVDKASSLSRIKQRMEAAKSGGYYSYPNSGTVFKGQYGRITNRLLRNFRIGGAKFKSGNGNWIDNVDNASSSDVMKLIRIAGFINCLTHLKKPILEIEVWS